MHKGGKPCASARRGTDGFTLVEMLAALAILALFASYLPQAYGLIRRTWTMSTTLARDDPEQVTRMFLMTRLSEASPIFERKSEGDEIAFKGTPDSVSFIAPLLHAPRGSGLYKFRVFQAGDAPGRGRLHVTLEPYVPVLQSNSERAPVAPDVYGLAPTANLSLRYFGRPAAREKAIWQDAWPRVDALPDLVEITLRRDNGTVMPTIAVELRLRSGQ